MSRPILPGATLGVLGSGQLGRMFAIAARRMGYRVHVLSPDYDTPTGQVADMEIRAPYGDLDRVAEFARNVSVVTFEFENVPSATTDVAAKYAPVRPSGGVLHATQNRLREKTALRTAGLPVTPFLPVASREELRAALGQLGTPAVLKTADWGYDGKGQVRIDSPAAAESAWTAFEGKQAILEAFIPFEKELSVVAARGIDGSFGWYGPIENSHRKHILDISVFPADVPPAVRSRAVEIARAVVEDFEVVGVLCVEFFLSRGGELMINETAPRPHNSGHLTIDAHVSCQFEQQVRAICGLPLGSTRAISPAAAMANLLGDLWADGEPIWEEACGIPDLKLHLYGKVEARPGRKMGHLTALAAAPAEAVALVQQGRQLLTTPA